MNQRSPEQAFGLSRRPAVVIIAVALIAGLVALVVALRPEADTESQAPSSHAMGGAQRTVIVATEPSPALSSPDGLVRAVQVRGAVPRSPVEARVLTDEDCAPDDRGVSHCLNRLQLENGSALTVRHNHRMSDIACLTPGERVRVRPAQSQRAA